MDLLLLLLVYKIRIFHFHLISITSIRLLLLHRGLPDLVSRLELLTLVHLLLHLLLLLMTKLFLLLK